MEQNDTPRNLLIAAAVFVSVLVLFPKIMPEPSARPRTPPGKTDPALPSSTSPQAANDGGGLEAVHAPAERPVHAQEAGTPDAAHFTVIEAAQVETLQMGALEGAISTKKDAERTPYRLRLSLTNLGAGVSSASLTDHAESIDNPARYKLISPVEREDGRHFASLTIEKITVDDVPLSVSDKRWNASAVTPYESASGEKGQSVEFSLEIQEDGTAALKLSRTLALPQQSKKSGRHDLHSTITVENVSDRPHTVLLAYRGGLGIRANDARMDDRYVDFGIRSGGFVSGARKTQAEIAKRAPNAVELFSSGNVDPGTRLSWAATANTYFTCTVAPLAAGGSGEADYITQVEAIDADAAALSDDDVTVRFVTRGVRLDPGGTLRYPAAIYLGEKDGQTFKGEDDYKSRNYYYQISQGYGWCTFTWLVELMIWLLNGLFLVVRDFGVAIIILVLIVRTILHPITKKGQVNMVRMQHRMQELAPKIEEIKKKYANDKTRLNQELMKLNMNPAGQLLTCLPMVLQMPIWVALYLSLSNNILMRHESFHFTWIHDLTAQDALWTFNTPLVVPFVGWVLPSLNLLPILVALFMYLQQKTQPKPPPSPNMTDQQRQQQEMMQAMMPLMSVMMLFIFYKMPAGLNLYIMSSSLFGTIEQKRIRAHIKEREQAGTLHKPETGRKPENSGERPRRAKPSFFQKLQKMAEEAHKSQARRPRGGKDRR